MRKSVLKRIKITGTGKLLRRRPHQNHLNAKESGSFQLRKKTMSGFSPKQERKMKAYAAQ